MKEKIDLKDYTGLITDALKRGILLNTNGDKFNSMVIGWGALGTVWGRPAFTVYVRENRYTKSQLDKTGEFTVSIPLGEIDRRVNRICGLNSGYNIDKVREAGLTLEEPETNHVPGIKEYPLTIECKVLYRQTQIIADLPENIQKNSYPQDIDGTSFLTRRRLFFLVLA